MLEIKNNSEIKTSFNDDSKITNWIDEYIDGLSKIGILDGYKEDNTFRSNNNIKRAEYVKILSISKNIK